MKKSLQKSRSAGTVKTVSAVLLLLLYFTGSVQVESLHNAFHSFEQALHSTEQEEDPCHRAIYHDEKENACEHKTHVTAVKKCPLCHVVPFSDQQLGTQYKFEVIFPADEYYSDKILSEVRGDINFLPARAPPAI
jgi:hypothetical protein